MNVVERTDHAVSTLTVLPAERSHRDHRAFGEELDALKRRTLARINFAGGAEDVAHVKRINRFSRAMEIIGRVLIHVSFEPITFALGVCSLWVHKQLQATEIGHTALHGAYDKLEGADAFASETFRWDTPIDEESWRQGHNIKHHGYTNVTGKDPDIHFGPARLTEKTPYRPSNRFQLPFMVGILAPNFAFLMNTHFTGLNDVFFDNGLDQKLDVLPDRSPASVRGAWRKALRKWVPYYAKNYVFFPLLAGPMFWKVLLGNWLAEVMRDVYSAATIYCGHVGEDVKSYAAGTKAHGRGQWYAMQVEATNNFEVSRPISILCGGLDRQIEHHLFPTFPPERLREIAPEVRAICERHGIEYKTDTWGRTLKKALAHVARLAHDGGVRDVIREMA
jgi:linoleoyl-CoA desaturase